VFDRLSAPFPVDAIHWRAQLVAERSGAFTGLALAYLDARDVQDRLDTVCGPENWQDAYEETGKGRLLCKLSIRVEGEWITKSDGSGDSDIEGEKGAISGALKRAAVRWGIGRYLYEVGDVWAPCEVAMRDGKPVLNKNNKPIFRKWKPEASDVFGAALSKLARPSGPISDTTRDWLIAQLQSVQMPPATLLNHFRPKDLRELTFEQMAEAKRFIDNSKQKEAA
jgi:hypothetical protein